MLIVDSIFYYLILRTILESDAADRIFEESQKFLSRIAESTLDHLIGKTGSEKLKEAFNWVSGKIFKRSEKEIKNLVEEVLVFIAGEEIYERVKEKIKEVKNLEDLKRVLIESGDKNPEKTIARLYKEAPDRMKKKMNGELLSEMLFLISQRVKENREILDEIKREIEVISGEYGNLKDLANTYKSYYTLVPTKNNIN